MLIHTIHQRSTLHFTPRFFSLSFTFRRFISMLQIPSHHFTSIHFTYNYFPNPLFKNMWFTGETLVNNQLDAQFLYFIIRLLSPLHVSSNVVLIIRRSNCINTASGIVTLRKWPSGAPDGHLQRGTIPDAVLI